MSLDNEAEELEHQGRDYEREWDGDDRTGE